MNDRDTISIGGGGRLFTLLIAATLALASVGGVATADNTVLNYGDDADTPTVHMEIGELEKQSHRMKWGTSDSALATYYDDSGDTTTGPFVVNHTADNPISFYVTDVEANHGEFPRLDAENGDNSASALDASEWSKDTSGVGTAGASASISDSTTAEGTDALNVTTSGLTAGDTATFTYSNVSITTDVQKRVEQIAADVETLDSGAVADVRLNDADGDYVRVQINGSADASQKETLANATSTGAVTQQKVSDATVKGSGDGTMSEISSVEITVSDGDVETHIAWLDAERKSVVTLAEEKYQADDDDELETRGITQTTGEISTYDLETLPSMWSNATIHNLRFPARITAAELAAEDVDGEREQTDKYGGYDGVGTFQYRMSAPAALELSYSSVSLEADQEWPSGRYISVEVIESAGDTDFSDLDYDSSGNDVTGSYSSEGSTVTLDDTIQIGNSYAVRIKSKHQSKELNAMFATGGGGGLFGGGGGGGLGIVDAITGGVMSLLGLLGLKKANWG